MTVWLHAHDGTKLKKRRKIVFNGKFLSAGPSGVHRVAEELILGVDKLLENNGAGGTWQLLFPKDVKRRLPLREIVAKTAGVLTWQFWEQFEFPWLTRKDLVINLCNLAPLASRGGITMIHDAQVFISPESYSWMFRTWYRFALPRIGANASHILTVSNYSRERLVEFGVAPAHKIKVIHNGIDHLGMLEADPECLKQFGLRPGTYVVAPATAQKHKNIKLLLEVFAKPQMEALTLVLTGNGSAEQFQKAGIHPNSNVLFLGHVSDAQLRALYESAICFAYPSLTEGFGMPPLEAMRAGCPAIVAPCGALSEVCGDAAIYVGPHDSEGWKKAIIEMASDGDLRTQTIERGRKRAAQFTWNRAAKQLMDIITETVDAQSA